MMVKRLPWLLLAISVALNLFVVVGLLDGEQTADRQVAPEARLVRISEQLSLTPEQLYEFEHFSKNLGDRWRMFREYMEPVRIALADELAKPEFDRDSYLSVLRMRQEVREEYFLQFGEELHAYIRTLEPEQQTRFVELARERGFLRRLMGGRSRAKPGESPTARGATKTGG